MRSKPMCVLQDWVVGLPLMMQGTLLTCIRGPDGIEKYGPHKMLLRWYRRCVLLGSFERRVLSTPYELGGGSFTGPSYQPPGYVEAGIAFPPDLPWTHPMNLIVDGYVRQLDTMPLHFHGHLMHAAEIVGYYHPDDITANWWHNMYKRFVNDLHLNIETKPEMDKRLSDDVEEWLARSDPATTA